MSTAFTIGKRQLKSDEVLPLLSGHSLWPQLMQGMVIDRELRTMSCTREEINEFYRRQIDTDPDFLDNKKEQLLLEGAADEDVEFFVNRPLLLDKFKKQTFLPLAESAFLKMKAGLDKVSFLMIRNKDHELLRELYFRIESGEESFESVAARYSEGKESMSGGKLGPLELKQLNPVLAKTLSEARPGALNPPVVIDGFGVITMLREKSPAHLDDNMRKQIVNHLFNEWVNKEVQAFFY
ncbi:MAG: peptidylprolyl isomerase [Chlorobiaceae bacterium]|nr:peptidylprolyl isomerase [Chlorobiaceae bacterium]NTW10567.1 peptidylprolyl isomerase [Chlorobiaceae bacterium]